METTGSFVATVDPTDSSAKAYEDFYLRARFITGLILYPMGCIFGLTGNALSVIVLSQKKMVTSTNIYLIALAISDSIKLLNDLSYFITILLLNVHPPTGDKAYGYLYPYAHYFFNMSTCTTAWLTISVAAERYIMVCHATKARQICSIARAKLTSVLVFITMSLMTIPFALRYKTVHYVDTKTNETIPDVQVTHLWQNTAFERTFTWTAVSLRSIIPLVILCTLNYFIVQALRRTRSTRQRLSSRHRITLMLIFVILVFMICVTPDAIMSTVFGMGYTDASFLVRGIREITDFLLLLNSSVNVILYCTFNRIFRKNFMALFFGRCHIHHRTPITTEHSVFRRSSFTSFRASVMNGSGRREPPLCAHEFTQSAI